jgi:thioredoxin 1
MQPSSRDPEATKEPGVSSIIDVTDETFGSEVEASSTPVIVDFWAPWCTPCRVMDPILDELAGQHQGHIKFTKMNVDENQQTAGRYQILSIPTLMVFEGGEVRHKLVGAVPRRRLEDELTPWLAPA